MRRSFKFLVLLAVAAFSFPLSVYAKASDAIIPGQTEGALVVADLGQMDTESRRISRDHKSVLARYLDAAEKGDPSAQVSLGLAFEIGRGIQQDYHQALYWYRRSAQQGIAAAQNNLGNMIFHGKGTAQDSAEAMNWFRRAADQGQPNAQTSVGWIYQKGLGVEVNYAEAFRWNRMSAEQGEPNGQSNLAELYLNGQGTSVDPAAAYEWASLAAEKLPEGKSRDGAIVIRDAAAKKLTEEELGSANQWVKNWRPVLDPQTSGN